MPAIWIAMVLLVAMPAIAADTAAQKNPTVLDSPAAAVTQQISAAENHDAAFPPRTPAEMRKAVSDTLRATATAKDPAARDRAIRRLILILLELEQDQNLTHDERVELHTQVRSRLTTLEQTLRTEAARGKKSVTAQADQQRGAASAQLPVAILQSPTQNGTAANANVQQQAQENLTVLAQVIGAAAGVNVQQGGVGPGAFAGRGIAAQPAAGGIGVIGGQAAGGGNAQQLAPDYGPDLVSLIQTVIAPRTWDVNGGPGSVVYYRNLRALVISAPADVHDQLGDVLGQLRK